jgi:hypothetical protein
LDRWQRGRGPQVFWFGGRYLALLQEFNLPVTRQDYLNLANLGRPPKQLSAEEEADLPKEVR